MRDLQFICLTVEEIPRKKSQPGTDPYVERTRAVNCATYANRQVVIGLQQWSCTTVYRLWEKIQLRIVRAWSGAKMVKFCIGKYFRKHTASPLQTKHRHVLSSPTSATYLRCLFSGSTYKKGSIWRPATSTHTRYILTMSWYTRSSIAVSRKNHILTAHFQTVVPIQNLTVLVSIIIIIIISFLSKGRFFTANSGTKAAILPKGKSSIATQESRLQFY